MRWAILHSRENKKTYHKRGFGRRLWKSSLTDVKERWHCCHVLEIAGPLIVAVIHAVAYLKGARSRSIENNQSRKLSNPIQIPSIHWHVECLCGLAGMLVIKDSSNHQLVTNSEVIAGIQGKGF